MQPGIRSSVGRNCVGAVLLTAAVVMWSSPETSGAAQHDAAERILQLARSKVSESQRMESVGALSVDMRRLWDNGQDAQEAFGLLLPDKFQVRTGRITHTLAGEMFWQDKENPPAILEQARTNTRDRAARMTILFLLRIPRFADVQAVARPSRRFEGKQADVVDFKGDSLELTLFVDAASHLPLGFESGVQTITTGATPQENTKPHHRGLLQDYRAVRGVRFPFRMDETIGEFHSVVTVQRLDVNPPDIVERFKKR